MFEKEAKEYSKKATAWIEDREPLDQRDIEIAYQKGAIDAYNKANEWHYVKDGDLPKEDIYLILRLNDVNTCYKCCAGFWEKEENCFHTLFCSRVDTKDIIAWKEIVLPELEE